MKLTQGLTGAALLALVAAGAVGMYLTSRPASPVSASTASPALTDESPSLDSRYLKTAIRLAPQAETPAERRAAENALSAAERELDLQYAYALQLAATAPSPATPRIDALRQRIETLDKNIDTRRAEVTRLPARVQPRPGARRRALEQQLDVRRAELEFLHEARQDAQHALDQAGGSPQGWLTRLQAEHTALSQQRDAFKFPAYADSPLSDSLLARWSRWQAIGRGQSRVSGARQAADAGVADLTSRRNSLEKRIAAEEAQGRAWWNDELTPRQVATLPSSITVLVQRISSDRSTLRIIDHQVRDMNALVSAYARWGALLGGARRAALHRLLASGLWIVVMMASAFFLNRLIEHLFAGLSLERRQKATLQAVLRILVQVVAVIVILMIAFGKPRNLSTVLGLAGAGLAIALQNFILSFLGWFVLRGRHGGRVGDFVEINQNSFTGVRGEVVEITPFRTVLLETGNWNEPGRLTGRKVAFMNMYAVAGYYFNFSTSGQWLWDELQVALPRSETPYPLLDRMRALVAEATESQTTEAEREWEHVSARYGTRSFSARPDVSIRSTDSGVIAVIRYVTRADERPAMRNHLSQEIIKLLHEGEEPAAAESAEAGAAEVDEILLAGEAAGAGRR